jgi:peptide/nickel transport system permease protein
MTTVDVALPSPRARRRRLLRKRFLARPAAVVSLVVILVFVGVAIFAPLVAPYSPNAADLHAPLAHPSWQHVLGTDDLGRDVLSRLIWGARASMQVGFLSTVLAMLIAVPLGLVAGYYRGWPDAVIARTADILLAFPFLILAIGLAAILGPSLTTSTLALGIASVPGPGRTRRDARAARG